MIIYGNRYRSIDSSVEEELEKATALFYKGQYEKALELATHAVNIIEK